MQKLQVPDNISLRRELIRGIGTKDLLLSLLLTAAAIPPAVLYCAISSAAYDTFTATAFVVIVLTFCLGFFTRLDGGLSICDYLRQSLKYRNSQQIFSYVYTDKEVLTYLPEETETSGEDSDRPGIFEC